jgi:alginate O-acetyltransferase complex protein AlgI
LILIVLSTIVDFYVGIGLSKTDTIQKRKALLLISIVINLGFLWFFKYYNFFIESFVDAYKFFGHDIEPSRLHIILPVGISFYTFQTMSYSIDVYRRKIIPTKNFIPFFAFVVFFPQLVAGPIERAKNLLPQFYNKRYFEYDIAIQGISQIIWGLFKKVVIADSAAIIVNQIFDNYIDYTGSTLLIGGVLFAFQIYGDFSGYSDIAVGTAKLFGIELKRNFANPYFSRDIAEFWRRWHISLTSWFKDYVYIPLGGSRGNTWSVVRNTFAIFLISGFWHGANWTYIVWGLYHSILFLPLVLTKKNTSHIDIISEKKRIPNLKEFVQIITTFILVVLGWIIFRAENIKMVIAYFSKIFSESLVTKPYVYGVGKINVILLFLFIFLMISLEWFSRPKEIPIFFEKQKKWIQWFILYIFVLFIFLFGEKQQDFIYFQF